MVHLDLDQSVIRLSENKNLPDTDTLHFVCWLVCVEA